LKVGVNGGNLAAMAIPAAIITTLLEYDVTVEEEGRHNEVVFWIDDKRLTYRFDPAQPDASDLRVKLQNFGATRKVSASTIATIVTAEEPEQKLPEPAPPEPKVKLAPEVKPTTPTKDGYPTVFRSARVLAVELVEDLMVQKGHMLVIPLNRPNTLLDMTRDQFHALFDATTERPTEPETPPPPPPIPPEEPVIEPKVSVRPTVDVRRNDENDVLAYLLQRNGGVKLRVIADALGMTYKAAEATLKVLTTRGTVELENGFWRLAARPPLATAPPPKKKGRPAGRPPVFRPTESSRALPPQIGRILAAMAYVTANRSDPDLRTNDVAPYLIDRDARQYGARIPAAMEAGWVLRGKALPPPAIRGFYYQITPSGVAAVKEAGTRMYEADGEKVPDWLDRL
jgi:hypothetical protein